MIGRFQDFSDSCIGPTLGLKAVRAANQEAFGVRLSQYTNVILTLILQKSQKEDGGLLMRIEFKTLKAIVLGD